MNRFLAVTILAALLSAWVGAQGSNRPSANEQARLVRQNGTLYRAAIDNGLKLTDQDKREDELHRAHCYTDLARHWAQELGRAAKLKDTDRVNELGQHLSQLVDRGVVPNLEIARQKIKSGSEFEKELLKQRDEAVGVLKPLEDSLRPVPDFATVADDLSKHRAKIEAAAKPADK